MKPTPILLLTWLGAAVRWRGVFANTFHTDEALFASWGRLIGLWRDPLLLGVGVVDKPPLLFYGQALFYPLLGQVEWAARLPNLVAGVALVPLTAVLAYRLTADGRASFTAALLVALSPLAIQFTPTAFTDPLMTTLVVAGLVAAVAQRPRGAALWLGLAIATKYQAVLFVPLAWLWGTNQRRNPFYLSLFTFYILLPILLILAWDYGRTGAITLWQAQMNSYGGVRLAWSWELWPRWWAWVQMGWYGWGVGWLGVGWLLGGAWLQRRLPLGQGTGDEGLERVSVPRPLSVVEQARNAPPLKLKWLGWFVLGYLLAHWLLAIPVWDRYLLPLVPLTAVWVAGVSRQPRLALLGLLLLVAAWPAYHGRWPIGGQPTADGGASAIAQPLLDAPYGTVLYDHWYSWHWRYQLIDTGVYVSWFPHPAALVEDVAVFGTADRYLVLPADGRARPVLRHLAEAGVALHPISAEGEMVLYALADK